MCIKKGGTDWEKIVGELSCVRTTCFQEDARDQHGDPSRRVQFLYTTTRITPTTQNIKGVPPRERGRGGFGRQGE